MGLDMQRLLRIRLDVVSNECTRELKDGSRREVQLAQAAGSGLPLIRVDDFERHDEYLEYYGLPSTPKQFEQYRVAADSIQKESEIQEEKADLEGDHEMDDVVIHALAL